MSKERSISLTGGCNCLTVWQLHVVWTERGTISWVLYIWGHTYRVQTRPHNSRIPGDKAQVYWSNSFSAPSIDDKALDTRWPFLWMSLKMVAKRHVISLLWPKGHPLHFSKSLQFPVLSFCFVFQNKKYFGDRYLKLFFIYLAKLNTAFIISGWIGVEKR